jgi:3-oxoacyl-[acyl-carrier protein] reductase
MAAIRIHQPMTSELHGKIALVTGASRGIGKAIAIELAGAGCDLLLTARDAAALAATAEAVQARGRKAEIHVADLRSEAEATKLVERVAQRFGRLDILVNNATNVTPGGFFAMDEAGWDRVFDSKLRGTVRCIRHAVPFMRERKWGRIVNISGGAAWTPQLGAITTGLNNAAVQNLTVALANELGKDGILVNAIVPTAVRTERHDNNIRDTMQKTGQSEADVLKPRVAKIPLGRMGTPDEIAAAVVFLASERASFITGAAFAVDGGVSARL